MALPGHSPPPTFMGSRSPSRVVNGHAETQMPSIYGQSARAMLPPSPQQYRFSNAPPIPTPSPSLPPSNEHRNAPTYKRPGSSMSISSMLGGEPERLPVDTYQTHDSRGPSRQGSMSAPSINPLPAMSPPQPVPKSGVGDYSYKPRSQTPDMTGASFNGINSRQRSSSSGTPLTRLGAFNEAYDRAGIHNPSPRFNDPIQPPNFVVLSPNRSEHDDRVRRTSLSGILQRPSSQPQPGQGTGSQQESLVQNGRHSVYTERQQRPEAISVEPFRSNGMTGSYDTKPPAPNNTGHLSTLSQMHSTPTTAHMDSPEIHRSNTNGNQTRFLASILNGPTMSAMESSNPGTTRMVRQDSTQSQGDLSALDRGKFRQYSPFAGSFTLQHQSTTNIPADSQGRKGSDELSHHRTILGLAGESKRGRFSPMPQVMQGAQAQTPVPDAGIKTEHGRVFSGLGGGVSTTPVPIGTPLKKDRPRSPLNEETSTKMSRSSSGLNKRSRKFHDDDINGDTEAINGIKGPGGRATKKGKYQHSYKFDIEGSSGSRLARRTTPLTGLNSTRNASVTSNSALASTDDAGSRLADTAPPLRPKKIVKVASIFNNASRTRRRHLGNFTYRPHITPSDLKRPNTQDFNISIIPNLFPCFSAAEHINCTYTIHVPRMWLKDRERSLICAEQAVWGSGVYTDDSDPVAAAVHAGYLKASFGEGVDGNLLARVVQDRNPEIEWPQDLEVPSQPMDIEENKDLNITLVVLPLLEHYEGSARFGIKSKSWPENHEKNQHDGVSFGILKIEFANVGMQEMRIGRTGSSRRQRLRMDLASRQRGLQLQKERVAAAKQKQAERLKHKASKSSRTAFKAAPTSAPVSISESKVGPSLTTQAIAAIA